MLGSDGGADVQGSSEMEEEEEKPPLPPPSRMGECQLCSKPAKYRCPACAVASCSLECSRAHKTAGGGCSGKRDRAAFKDIREFTDADVVSDYRFLEEALLEKDRAKRWRPQFGVGSGAAARSDRPPAAAKVIALLTQQAKARGVELFCMPDGMARRVSNTTFYDRRRDLLQWRVEWIFHATPSSTSVGIGSGAGGDGNGGGGSRCGGGGGGGVGAPNPKPVVKAEDTKMDETTTLLAALQKHLEQGPGRAARLHELRRYTAAMKTLLAGSGSGGSGGSGGGDGELAVFLEKDGCPANAKRFYRLKLDDTLKANLQGKRLLEFPTLLVAVLPEDAHVFPEPEEPS